MSQGLNPNKLSIFDLWAEKLEEPVRQIDVRAQQYVNQVVFGPDAKTVAASAWDIAWVWDLSRDAADASPTILSGQNVQFNSIAISANGQWAISQSGSGDKKLWSLAERGSKPSPLALSGDERVYMQNVQLSPDGSWVAAWSQTGSKPRLRVWNLSADNPLQSPREVPTSQERSSGGMAPFRFTADGRYLASARQGEIALWDLTAEKWEVASLTLSTAEVTGTERRVIERSANSVTVSSTTSAQPIASLAVDRGGRFLVAADSGGSILFWDLKAPDPNASKRVIGRDPGAWGLDLSISPSGRWLITSRHEESPRVWDLADQNIKPVGIKLTGHDGGRSESVIGGGVRAALPGVNISFLGVGPPSSQEIGSGERWVITRGNDSKPRLWDLWAQNPARAGLQAGTRRVEGGAAAVRADGSWVVWNRTNVRIVNPDSKELVTKTFEIRNRPLSSSWSSDDQPLSKDGRWLAMNHVDRVHVWDLTNEKSFASPQPPNLLVRLGLAAAKATEAAGAQKVVTAEKDQRFSSVSISPDGRWLLTQANDGWRLWSLKDEGSATVALRLSEVPVQPHISPDGRWLSCVSNHRGEANAVSLESRVQSTQGNSA